MIAQYKEGALRARVDMERRSVDIDRHGGQCAAGGCGREAIVALERAGTSATAAVYSLLISQ
jgi:hypothetical protein